MRSIDYCSTHNEKYPCYHCQLADRKQPRLEVWELQEVDNRYPRSFYLNARARGQYDFTDEELNEMVKARYVREDPESKYDRQTREYVENWERRYGIRR